MARSDASTLQVRRCLLDPLPTNLTMQPPRQAVRISLLLSKSFFLCVVLFLSGLFYNYLPSLPIASIYGLPSATHLQTHTPRVDLPLES